MMGSSYTYATRKYRNYIAPRFVQSEEKQCLDDVHGKLVQKKIETKQIKVYLQKFQPIAASYLPKFKVYEWDKQVESTESIKKTMKLKILTYNIWFQNNNIENRIPCILKMLEESDADIICLQEVTKGFIQDLDKSSVLRKRYPVILRNLMNWYDTIILSKYHCRSIRKSFKNTHMARGMLLAEIVIEEGNNIIIGSMHYESLDSTQARISQLKQTFEACKECPNVIIVGDFNFSDQALQNKQIHAYGYTDLWLEDLKRKNKNFSMKESCTMPKTPRFSQWRPDHVIYKLSSTSNLHKIMKIGEFTVPPFEKQQVNQISKDGIVRTPSDHFGLLSQLII